MGPGEDEFCCFDGNKERLWLTFVFYADRVPELYDFFEDDVFTDGPIKEFITKFGISFPSRGDLFSGKFLESLADDQVNALIEVLDPYMLSF